MAQITHLRNGSTIRWMENDMDKTKAATHTPGPWVWGFYGPTDDWVRTSEGDAIVQVGHNAAQRVENARLIAAAPDLLASLHRLTDLCRREGWDDYASDGLAAIRKAEGPD